MARSRTSAKQAGARFERIVADYLASHVGASPILEPATTRIGSGPGGATNTLRGLTHSLDLGKEGLMPQRTRNPYSRPCIVCGKASPSQTMGQPRKYCSDECFRKRRRRPVIRRSVDERLRDKLARNEATGCMEFTGHRNEHGYGVIRDGDGRTALAHRVAWAIENGAIPEGMSVRHDCDNPPCCNTDHLRLGTHAQNMRDRDARGRTLRGEAIGSHSDATIRRVRELLADGITHREVAAVTGVSMGHVAYIKKNPEWRAR